MVSFIRAALKKKDLLFIINCSYFFINNIILFLFLFALFLQYLSWKKNEEEKRYICSLKTSLFLDYVLLHMNIFVHCCCSLPSSKEESKARSRWLTSVTIPVQSGAPSHTRGCVGRVLVAAQCAARHTAHTHRVDSLSRYLLLFSCLSLIFLLFVSYLSLPISYWWLNYFTYFRFHITSFSLP